MGDHGVRAGSARTPSLPPSAVRRLGETRQYGVPSASCSRPADQQLNEPQTFRYSHTPAPEPGSAQPQTRGDASTTADCAVTDAAVGGTAVRTPAGPRPSPPATPSGAGPENGAGHTDRRAASTGSGAVWPAAGRATAWRIRGGAAGRHPRPAPGSRPHGDDRNPRIIVEDIALDPHPLPQSRSTRVIPRNAGGVHPDPRRLPTTRIRADAPACSTGRGPSGRWAAPTVQPRTAASSASRPTACPPRPTKRREGDVRILPLTISRETRWRHGGPIRRPPGVASGPPQSPRREGRLPGRIRRAFRPFGPRRHDAPGRCSSP